MEGKLGRRGFMAALGLGAAAAPVIGQRAATMLASESARNPGSGDSMGALAGYAGDSGKFPVLVKPWEARGITETIWKLWNSEADEAQQALERYAQCNVMGHDPVVFACKSWAPTFGVSYTYNKLNAMKERTRSLRERLWSSK